MLIIPSEIVSLLTTSLFIWCKKNRTKLKGNSCIKTTYLDGGLRMLNMEVLAKSWKLAWISRLLPTDMLSRKENWKAILFHCFSEYGGLNFLLHFNYNIKFLNQIDSPPFYKQILSYFLELKSLYKNDIRQEMTQIWIGNRLMFLKKMFKLGIVSIQDILSENGKFFPFKNSHKHTKQSATS